MDLDTNYFAPLELLYYFSDSASINIWSLRDRRNEPENRHTSSANFRDITLEGISAPANDGNFHLKIVVASRSRVSYRAAADSAEVKSLRRLSK